MQLVDSNGNVRQVVESSAGPRVRDLLRDLAEKSEGQLQLDDLRHARTLGAGPGLLLRPNDKLAAPAAEPDLQVEFMTPVGSVSCSGSCRPRASVDLGRVCSEGPSFCGSQAEKELWSALPLPVEVVVLDEAYRLVSRFSRTPDRISVIVYETMVRLGFRDAHAEEALFVDRCTDKGVEQVRKLHEMSDTHTLVITLNMGQVSVRGCSWFSGSAGRCWLL